MKADARRALRSTHVCVAGPLVQWQVTFLFNSYSKNFEVLGLPPWGASAALIKQAFRKLSLEFHPDKATAEEKEYHCFGALAPWPGSLFLGILR